MLARSVSEVADRSQMDSEVDTLGEAANASKLWLAANNYSGARRAVAASTRIISVASQLPRWGSLRSALNTAIVQQGQMAEKVAAMGQEDSKRKEEFDRIQAEARTSEVVYKSVLYVGIGVSLLLTLSYCSRLSSKEDQALLFVGALILAYPVIAVFALLGVLVNSIYGKIICARKWICSP